MLNNIEENKNDNINVMEVKEYEVLTNDESVGMSSTIIQEKNEQVVENTEEHHEKIYKFRRLNATDIGSMVRLVGKISLKRIKDIFYNEKIKSFISQNKNDNSEENSNNNLNMQVGIEIATDLIPIVLESYSLCENELFELLSKTSNLSVEEVKNLDFDVFFEMLFDFFKKEEFMGFLNLVLKLMNLA